MVDLSHLLTYVDKGGILALSLFVGYALIRGWIVPRWVHDQAIAGCEKRYDELKEAYDQMTEIALRTTHLSERATQVGETIIKERSK